MTAPSFISGKLSFKGRAAVASITVSIMVVIIAIAVSAGFRSEISSGLRTLSGDLRITQFSRSENPEPISIDSCLLGRIMEVEGVGSISPAIYSAGIVRNDETIHGVVFKGIETADSASLSVVVPSRLANMLGISKGDRMTAFFVLETVIPRNFTVADCYDSIVTEDDKLVVFCDIHTLRRVLGWEQGQCSVYEVNMIESQNDDDATLMAQAEISGILFESSDEESVPLCCERTLAQYPQLFDWLRLIDTNVSFILVLMIIVAAVNMISGLLILLFEHMGTIGLLKALGMTDASVAGTFLLVSARLVGLGMAIGTAFGVGLCLIQYHTHILELNPLNYFVSFVPVAFDIPTIVLYEIIAFVAIMLILLLPCRFISKVDPAKTVKEN